MNVNPYTSRTLAELDQFARSVEAGSAYRPRPARDSIARQEAEELELTRVGIVRNPALVIVRLDGDADGWQDVTVSGGAGKFDGEPLGRIAKFEDLDGTTIVLTVESAVSLRNQLQYALAYAEAHADR